MVPNFGSNFSDKVLKTLEFSLFTDSKMESKVVFNYNRNINNEISSPFSVKFAPSKNKSNLLCFCDESGSIKIWRGHKIEEVPLHDNSIFDFCWFGDNSKIATASADHTSKIFDLEKLKTLCTLKGHFASVRGVSVEKSHNTLISTASRDGSVLLWDVRDCRGNVGKLKESNRLEKRNQNGPVSGIFFAHGKKFFRRLNKRPLELNFKEKNCNFKQKSEYVQNHRFDFNRHSVSSVSFAFNRENTLISTGFTDGKIKMWDTRRIGKEKCPALLAQIPNNVETEEISPNTSAITQRPEEKTEPLISSSISRCGKRLSVVCSNGDLLVVDLVQLYRKSFTNFKKEIGKNECCCVITLKGAKSGSPYIKSALSPDGDFLVSGSGDGVLRVWNIESRKSSVIHRNQREISGVDWSWQNFGNIVTCSDDNSVKLWNPKSKGSGGF